MLCFPTSCFNLIKKRIQSNIPDHLFDETIITIKKEAMYLHSLLPAIVSERNIALREDFLANSGIDRFYVEELEHEYYAKNGLDLDELYQIRKGLNWQSFDSKWFFKLYIFSPDFRINLLRF